MTGLAAAFLTIGGFSLLLLVLSLVGAGRLHLHLGHLHLGQLHLGHAGSSVDLSLPVIAGFLGAFGFGGAIAASVVPGDGPLPVVICVATGLAAAGPAGWLAGKLVNAAMNMPTDATLTSNDLVGAVGVVISPVPLDGYGEVRLSVGGQPFKVNARCSEPLAIGARVFVILVPTPTSVLVEPLPEPDHPLAP